MRLSNKIVLASTNRGKLEEFKALLGAYPEVDLHSAQEFIRNPEGIQTVEKFETYLENAMAKSRLVNQACHYPALGDDSGLEVMALEGRPGVHSRRFAPAKRGLTQDQANLQHLLAEMKGQKKRDARFVCTLTLVIEGLALHATGVLEGTLIEEPRGTHGFGYDPIFLPKGQSKTLAEMIPSEKNTLSHRAKALHELMTQVRAHGLVLAKP